MPAAFIKMKFMANLTLIYGLRLLPEGEVTEIQDATLKLANGHQAHVTMHLIEGSREEIEIQLKRSLDAFFDFYPEIRGHLCARWADPALPRSPKRILHHPCQARLRATARFLPHYRTKLMKTSCYLRISSPGEPRR